MQCCSKISLCFGQVSRESLCFQRAQLSGEQNTWEERNDPRRSRMLGVALLHWRAHLNNTFYSIDLSSKKTSQVRKNPSGSPSSPPRDTDHYIHFAAMQTKVGREAKAPFPAPGGAGQAAKLCPPTMPLVSPGEHSLSKQTLQGRDRSCPQPASAQKPLEFLCQTHGSSELLLPIQPSACTRKTC